jgi:hypothetical protein
MPPPSSRRHLAPRAASRTFAITALLLANTAAAQAPPAAPRLTQTGRVFAMGNGIAGDLCFVTPDSKRILVLGRERDAVWLDLPARQVLRHVDPPGPEFERVQVHASEPWLVWRAADGRGLRIDLDTGQRTDLGKEQVDQLPKTGWLEDGRPWQGESAASPNGKFRVVLEEGRWRREPSTGRRFPVGWIANDGLVFTTDQSELVLFGMNPFQTRRIPLRFCGSPTRLAFTTDGSYLAVMSGTQVQVVDAAGKQIAVLPGPSVLTAGPANDEFWLVGDGPPTRWSASAPSAVQADATKGRARQRLDHVLVREGQVWSGDKLMMSNFKMIGYVMMKGGAVAELIGSSGMPEALGLVASEAKNAAFLLMPFQESGKTVLTELWRYDGNRKVTHEVRLDGPALWLTTVMNGTHVAVGSLDGTMELFDCDALQPVKKVQFPSRLLAAVAWRQTDLIVSIGDRLQRIDANTLAVLGDIALPDGLPHADQLAISPDGRRLAIACGSDVRILTIE